MSAIIETKILQDNFEKIGNQIAYILSRESERQFDLGAIGRKIVVRQDKYSPYEDEKIRNFISIALNNISFNYSIGNLRDNFHSTATFDIYCYGSSPSTTFERQDSLAAEECSTTTRIARNILMAAHYYKLGMENIVIKKELKSITRLEPQNENTSTRFYVCNLISIEVEFYETSPQHEICIMQVASASMLDKNGNQIAKVTRG